MITKTRKAINGFTLIELLAVIVVIGIIVGLTVPAVTMALNKAKSTKDISNLRQMGILAAQYSVENEGALMASDLQDSVNGGPTFTAQWQLTLARLASPNKVVPGVWSLPNWAKGGPPYELLKEYSFLTPPWYKIQNWEKTGYGMSVRLGLPENPNDNSSQVTPNRQRFTMATVTYPSKRPYIFSWVDWNLYPENVSQENFDKSLSPSKKMNILFCDGHVESIGINDRLKLINMMEDPGSM